VPERLADADEMLLFVEDAARAGCARRAPREHPARGHVQQLGRGLRVEERFYVSVAPNAGAVEGGDERAPRGRRGHGCGDRLIVATAASTETIDSEAIQRDVAHAPLHPG
jgi:hypothetical protein